MSDEDRELDWLMKKKLMELYKKNISEKSSKTIHSRPIIATDYNFEELVKKYPVVVVDFWAEWCLPCRVIAPIIEDLAEEYAGRVVFLKLNVDENPITSSRYGITSIPTLIIFKDGRPVDVIVGAYPKKVIEERIRARL
ncbi:MAG: thioredoxin [Candidatus Caldarchaeales archaeon]